MSWIRQSIFMGMIFFGTVGLAAYGSRADSSDKREIVFLENGAANATPDEIGVLYVDSEGKLTFRGDIGESAKALFTNVQGMVDEYVQRKCGGGK